MIFAYRNTCYLFYANNIRNAHYSITCIHTLYPVCLIICSVSLNIYPVSLVIYAVSLTMSAELLPCLSILSPWLSFLSLWTSICLLLPCLSILFAGLSILSLPKLFWSLWLYNALHYLSCLPDYLRLFFLSVGLASLSPCLSNLSVWAICPPRRISAYIHISRVNGI